MKTNCFCLCVRCWQLFPVPLLINLWGQENVSWNHSENQVKEEKKSSVGVLIQVLTTVHSHLKLNFKIWSGSLIIDLKEAAVNSDWNISRVAYLLLDVNKNLKNDSTTRNIFKILKLVILIKTWKCLWNLLEMGRQEVLDFLLPI